MTALAYELQQGTSEWLAIRKTKITATDAAVIMGVSPWKTREQLFSEKLSDDLPMVPNHYMQRGLDLEPIARSLFQIQTGIEVEPKVVIKDWAMASLDGISPCGKHLVEIKCPGAKDHAIALANKIPAHYYPQLQHQMWVCDVEKMSYFSFDGADGVIVEVARDHDYIWKMIDEEHKFYMNLKQRTRPEPAEGEYTHRSDELWEECATKWKSLTQQIKLLEKQEEEMRKQLIFLSGQSNTKGAGISLCQVQRRGSIDYANIPELKDMDLEKYRKGTVNSWRIVTQ